MTKREYPVPNWDKPNAGKVSDWESFARENNIYLPATYTRQRLVTNVKRWIAKRDAKA